MFYARHTRVKIQQVSHYPDEVGLRPPHLPGFVWTPPRHFRIICCKTYSIASDSLEIMVNFVDLRRHHPSKERDDASETIA